MLRVDQIPRSPAKSGGCWEVQNKVPQDLFHRVENTTTQTKEVAAMQEMSREIWGRAAMGSDKPSVKAYPGNLPNRRGVEFTTGIEPTSGCAPNEARWHWEWCPGVQLRQKDGEDFACISVTSFNNAQP